MAENCYNEGNVDGAVKHYEILQKKEGNIEDIKKNGVLNGMIQFQLKYILRNFIMF